MNFRLIIIPIFLLQILGCGNTFKYMPSEGDVEDALVSRMKQENIEIKNVDLDDCIRMSVLEATGQGEQNINDYDTQYVCNFSFEYKSGNDWHPKKMTGTFKKPMAVLQNPNKIAVINLDEQTPLMSQSEFDDKMQEAIEKELNK